MADKKLVCIEIATARHVWNRCLFLDSDPVASDLEFYYKKLLGIQDAVIALKVEEVPAEFNTALLNLEDAAPSEFPANDLMTDAGESDKRKKYYDFLHQMCEMERSRASLRFFSKPAEPKKPSYTNELSEEGAVVKARSHRRAWVNDILASLNPESEYEENALVVASPTEEGPALPYGWVLTPTVQSARKERGCRIILDPEIGKKWEHLLGTYLYPDLVVSRRITSASWAFQHALSESLAKNILDWYIASQSVEVRDGITGFILSADMELGALMGIFRKVKVHEKFLTDGSNERTRAVYNLLSQVESRMLGNASDDHTIAPISETAFTRFMNYLFKGSGIPREMYADEVGVKQIIQRWVRSEMGFRADAEPPLSSWIEMWNLVMRGKPSAQKLNHFLASLDSWDPMQAVTMTNQERALIAQEWIRIYIDTQLTLDGKAKEKSIVLHDQVKRWTLRYLPANTFNAQLTPMGIGPVFTMRGLTSKKEKDGRYTHGIKFKALLPEEGAAEQTVGEMMEAEEAAAVQGSNVVETNTVAYTEISDSEEGTRSKKKTITKSIVAEKGSGRIEHFFAASVTTTQTIGDTETINLGSI